MLGTTAMFGNCKFAIHLVKVRLSRNDLQKVPGRSAVFRVTAYLWKFWPSQKIYHQVFSQTTLCLFKFSCAGLFAPGALSVARRLFCTQKLELQPRWQYKAVFFNIFALFQQKQNVYFFFVNFVFMEYFVFKFRILISIEKLRLKKRILNILAEEKIGE